MRPPRALGLAVALVAVLAAAACTSGDDPSEASAVETTTSVPADTTGAGDDGTAATSTTSEPVPTGPSPGVTEDAIRIGITYADLEAIREVTNVDHGDYEGVYRALIDEINASGGVGGRMLEPVFAPVNPIGTAPADEACLRLTQDEQVFAVLGFFEGEAALCYIETNTTAVIGGRMNDDFLARAAAPWFTPDPGGDLEADVVRAFAEDGLLDGPFAVYGLDQGQTDAVLAVLEDVGADPVETAVLDAPDDDVFAQNQATAVIAERFRSAGAETVLLVGRSALTWANGAEPTDYRPTLLLSDRNSADAFVKDQAGRDLTVFEGAILGGPVAETFDDPLFQERCVATVESAGIVVEDRDDVADGEPETFVSVFAACRYLTLFTAIAEAAGATLDYGSFQYAGERIGEVVIPGYPATFTFGPPPSADGDPPVYVYEFDRAAEDWSLVG